jgi:hypothetical protein
VVDVGALQRAGPQGPDDVRPDDCGSWIYIGSQGIVQGTHETFVEMGGGISAAISKANGS